VPTKQFSPKRAYTPGEFAEALSISKDTVYRRIADGSLPAVRLRGCRGYRLFGDDLNQYVEQAEASSK
jgi:excisionase family DNA binding protein